MRALIRPFLLFSVLLVPLLVPLPGGWAHHNAIVLDDETHCAEIPTLVLHLEPDKHTGWNLFVETTHFVFTPEKLDEEPLAHDAALPCPHEGYVTLFINALETRLYGPWFYISELPDAHVTLKAVLSGQTGGPYLYQGERISDSVRLDNRPPEQQTQN